MTTGWTWDAKQDGTRDARGKCVEKKHALFIYFYARFIQPLFTIIFYTKDFYVLQCFQKERPLLTYIVLIDFYNQDDVFTAWYELNLKYILV